MRRALASLSLLVLSVGVLHVLGDEHNRKLVVQLEQKAVRSVAFGSDGKQIVTGSVEVRLWDVSTGREIRKYPGHDSKAVAAACSDDGRYIVTGDTDAWLWNARTGEQIRKFPTSSKYSTSVAFSSDSRRLITGSDDNGVRLWDVETGKEMTKFEGHSSFVSSVAFAPNGQQVLTGSWDKTANLWDVNEGKIVHTFEGHSEYVTSVAFSPNGRQLLTASEDKTAQLWDAATGKVIFKFEGHSAAVSSVAFSPNGERVLTGSWDGTARLWDATTGKEVRRFAGHSSAVHSVAISPSGERVLTGSEDGTARLWDAATGEEIRKFEGHSVLASFAAFSPDGRQLVVGSADNTARLWDVGTGKEIRRLVGHSHAPLSVAWSRDSKQVLTGGADSTVRLWDASSGKEIRKFNADSEYVTSVAFSPDGKQVLACSSGNPLNRNTAQLWDTSTGRIIRRFEGRSRPIFSVAFSPDGRQVLAGGEDETVLLFDPRTGKETLNFQGHSWGVYCVAFASDGRHVVTGSEDNTARLWDAATGKEIHKFEGHRSAVLSVGFSRDGRYVFTGSEDGTARLWDAGTGRELRKLSGHSGAVTVSLSPDERQLLTASEDTTLRVWDAATGEELCSLVSFRDEWAVVAPDGRFDTDDLDDVEGLHWIATDEPLRPLPIEIFMRDYFEPKLLPRLLQGKQLRAIEDLSQLNRVQPEIKITDVNPDSEHADRVTVTVELADQSREFERDKRKVTLHSGAFDVRLFRDGHLVAYAPQQDGPIELAVDGKARLEFPNIKLPRVEGMKEVEFSAYAFNVDRVKSETHRLTYKVPELTPRKGVAYVVAVGVNSFEDSRWDLDFAVPDARLTAKAVSRRLQDSGQFSDVITLELLSNKEEQDNRQSTATRHDVRQVVTALAGQPPSDRLIERVPAAAAIKEAHPEDLVLISFSTHGHNGDNDRFYLFPSDIGEGNLDEIDDWGISTDDLMLWLRDVDAGEMVMIVDACQAAATVEQEGFKPGPMGSRGLGQLAYNKRMRILSASESDRPAYERADLGHGLLTYALVQNGLIEERAAKDGVITLGGWLAYAEQRVPKLYYGEVLKGKVTRAKGDVVKQVRPIESDNMSPRFQQPLLFDFTKGKDEVILVK